MTVPVPDQLEYISVADGVTRDFPYNRRFLQKDEVVVAFRVNDADTIMSLNIDYTIAGSSWLNGGVVSFTVAPPAGVKVVRYRRTAITQTVDLENKQRNDAKAVELQLDRLTMAGQDTDRLARGALHTDTPNGYRLSAPVSKKLLAWDEAGKAIVSSTKTIAELDEGIASAQRSAEVAEAAKDATIAAIDDISDDLATVVIMRPEIQAVIADKTNIGTVDKVAAIDASVMKVAAIDAKITTVAGISADVSNVSGIAPAVTTVANDRLTIAAVSANKTNIDAVAANKSNIDAAVANATNINAAVGNATNINAVAANGSDIDIVAANMPKVNIVAGIAPQVVTVAAIAPEVAAVGAVASSVPVVAAIDDKVAAVAANVPNITSVANNKTNIDAVAGNKTNIDAVKNNATNINAVAADKTNIDTVASSKAGIGTVAANITAVNRASDNMPAIIAAPTKAEEAAQSATDAAESKRLAELVTALMKGGIIGQLLIKSGNGDYEYGWADPSAGGDMFKLNYDPRGINADVFDMASMTEAANAKIMTAAERVKVAASTSNTGTVTSVAVAVPAGFATTPAITISGTITISYASGYQAYTIAEAQKLSGIDLSLYQALSQKNVANGYAGLDASGKLSENQLPAIAISDVFEAASQAAMLALTAENGDICVRSDLNKSFILKVRPASTLANWIELRTPTDAVLSVIGLGGAISRDDLRTKLELGSAAYSAASAFATATQFTALSTDKLDKTAQAADSALLNGKDEAGLVASGPVASAITGAAGRGKILAWAVFGVSGGVVIKASANIASITEVQAGHYNVTFATALSSANYVVAGSANSEQILKNGNAAAINTINTTQIITTLPAGGWVRPNNASFLVVGA